jgi:arylsulfatase A-like enzyme
LNGMCGCTHTPTTPRSHAHALNTGRLPFHVNIYNDDPALPGQGVPVGMTLLPLKLKQSGAGTPTPTPYATHFVGKWHIGLASKSKQIPTARGFDTSLGHVNKHWLQSWHFTYYTTLPLLVWWRVYREADRRAIYTHLNPRLLPLIRVWPPKTTQWKSIYC